jgi:hypothetical protein
MAYFVLAGGYWGKSAEFGKQVDPKTNDMGKVADYIVRIEGLPAEMLKPAQVKVHRIYHCDICDRDISEGEMEQKFGCFGHKNTARDVRTEQWDNGIFEAYTIKNKRWLSPMYRIWTNNEQGMDKWRQIMRYIEHNYPANKVMPLPIAMARGNEFVSEEEVIDEYAFINLATANKKEEENTDDGINAVENAPDEYKCDKCGKVFDKEQGLRFHKNRWCKG